MSSEKEEYSSDSDEYEGEDEEDEEDSSDEEFDSPAPKVKLPSMTKLTIKQDLNESFQSRINEDSLMKKEKMSITFYDKKSPKTKLLEKDFFALDDLSIIKLALSKELGVDYSNLSLFKESSEGVEKVGPDLLCVVDIYEEIKSIGLLVDVDSK